MKPYLHFNRKQWMSLNNARSIKFTEKDFDKIKVFHNTISWIEVKEIYLPLLVFLNNLINFYLKKQKSMNNFFHNKKKILIL